MALLRGEDPLFWGPDRTRGPPRFGGPGAEQRMLTAPNSQTYFYQPIGDRLAGEGVGVSVPPLKRRVAGWARVVGASCVDRFILRVAWGSTSFDPSFPPPRGGGGEVAGR